VLLVIELSLLMYVFVVRPTIGKSLLTDCPIFAAAFASAVVLFQLYSRRSALS
jgi:hypothetical protein